MTKLWIVGRALDPEDKRVWAFIGMFDDKQAAIEACTTRDHFVGPAILNERLPDELESWPGAYYPLASPCGETS